MDKRTFDKLGDQMKKYENTSKHFLGQHLPTIARIDGRAFHTFTKGLQRPYDCRLSNLMINTAKYLVEQTDALIGYTQSDEISLLWYAPAEKSQIFFNGNVNKINSVAASLATAYFNNHLKDELAEKVNDKLQTFDCRVFTVDSKETAVKYFIWREQDATRNSISMAAQSLYSSKFLHHKGQKEMQELLFDKGINWNDYPPFFKRGTYVKRFLVEKQFSAEELSVLPENHAAVLNPNLIVKRHIVGAVNVEPLARFKNSEYFLFGDK